MADVSSLESRIKFMKQSDNRKIIRFALDGLLRNKNVTDLASLVSDLKKLHVTLTTKDANGKPLDEYTLSDDDNPKFAPVKVSNLSKRYNYTNDNVKKALASNSLDPID